jgi:predicted nucleotidyltransferase
MKHPALATRKEEAQARLTVVQEAFGEVADLYANYDAFIYCAGSLGRGDTGVQSDLDLFLVTTRPKRQTERLTEVRLLSSAIEVNERLENVPFSNDGQFLKVYSFKEMLKVVGAPHDDTENLFTARILLLLESKCILGKKIYTQCLNRTIEHYFRDSLGKKSFRPLFLLNDLLRYWRTLCLNYEQIRSDQSRPWRKKNINLKFSRMLTVFGTILPILAEQMDSAIRIADLVHLTPHERFARGLDALNDSSLHEDYEKFLDDYESFLSWKDVDGTEKALPDEELGEKSRNAANRFSNFIYSALMHKNIDSDMKKYLVL